LSDHFPTALPHISKTEPLPQMMLLAPEDPAFPGNGNSWLKRMTLALEASPPINVGGAILPDVSNDMVGSGGNGRSNARAARVHRSTSSLDGRTFLKEFVYERIQILSLKQRG